MLDQNKFTIKIPTNNPNVVPIIDNAIAVRKDMGYAPYDDGVK